MAACGSRPGIRQPLTTWWSTATLQTFTNYKMAAEDSRFGNTFVNRSAGESWSAAAMAVRKAPALRASRALPEALHVCDNSTRSQVRLSGCSALPVA